MHRRKVHVVDATEIAKPLEPRFVHLQGIGKVSAKEAGELLADDGTIWEYGYLYRVLEVERLSPKFVRLVTASLEPRPGEEGKVYHRRIGRYTLVGVTK